MMTAADQENVALTVVAGVVLLTVGRPLFGVVRLVIARQLLKKGKVKWAMKLHHAGSKSNRSPHSRESCDHPH